ncbi:hypothetical protein D7294_04685 [Streptomyces hoynatensis]|uniref:Uncharacterized protein n=1 Tax=Streptomyces hoynatensis TaxID=1141874 RepID=A0A3A9ZBU3_9ACTN|nr:hypothetical protein D7294_04685 [Streptomyces hoynatensis]
MGSFDEGGRASRPTCGSGWRVPGWTRRAAGGVRAHAPGWALTGGAVDSAKQAVTLAASGTFAQESQDMTDLRNTATRIVTDQFGAVIGWHPPAAETE